MVSEDTKSLVPKASLASTAHARHMLTSREKQSHSDTTPEKTPEVGSGGEAAEQSYSVCGDVATALKVNSVDCVKNMTFNSANGKWKWKMSLLHKQTPEFNATILKFILEASLNWDSATQTEGVCQRLGHTHCLLEEFNCKATFCNMKVTLQKH